MNYNKILRIF